MIERTPIDGLLLVRSDTYEDERGFFRQTYLASELERALGRAPRFAQGNHSRSAAGVVRGFHAEPWDKLVYVVRGTAFCAVADLRVDSPTFAEVVTVTLGDPPGARARLFIAEGLGNAFAALDEVDYVYDVSEEWTPHADKRAIALEDPDLAVDWPVDEPVVSPADAANPTLRERFPDHPRWRR